MEPIRICMVGCGRVAKSHCKGALQVPQDVVVTAVVSRDAQKRAQFQQVYNVPAGFETLDEALRTDLFDAVDICLPNFLHEEAAVAAARAGKHVLVEKPMANTVEECERMVAACDESGVNLMVGQSRRYHDAVLKSRALLQQGEIGELVSITGTLMGYLPSPPTEWWRSSDLTGGLMIPLWGNHIIDYILFMFGEMPQRVYCEAFSVSPEWEGEDETTILLGFSENRFATVRMSWNTRFEDGKEWRGEKKMLASKDVLYERYIQGTAGTLKLEDETRLLRNGTVVMDGEQAPSCFGRQYQEFADSIRQRRKPMTDGASGIGLIQIQQAALESAATHRVIYL